MDQKLQLEEQLRAVMDKYKYKRRQIRELNDDLQVIIIKYNIFIAPYSQSALWHCTSPVSRIFLIYSFT